MVFIEHDGTNVLPVSRHAVTAAKKLGGEVAAIVVGPQVAGPAKEAAQVRMTLSKRLLKRPFELLSTAGNVKKKLSSSTELHNSL